MIGTLRCIPPLLAVAVAGAIGCSDAIVQPPEQTSASPTATITLQITTPKSTMVVGEELVIQVIERDATGRQISGMPVVWTSQSPEIVQVTSSGYPVGRVRGLSPGVASVSATVDGKSQTIVLTVAPLPAPSGAVLVVDAFSVIEFQYPSQPNHWYYAPLVRVRETNAGGTVAVIGYDFTIPGLGRVPSCVTYRPVGRGETLDLFREVYGDYGYTIDNNGARATGTVATAIITIQDGSGAPTSITVTGPIISGTLPTTYTGGTVDWRCN